MQLVSERSSICSARRARNEHVQKALDELPDKIDHEEHAAMLQQKFGLDPGQLAEKAIEKGLR